MAIVTFLSSRSSASVGAANTSYIPLGNTSDTNNPTESRFQVNFRTAGVLSKILINVASNDRAASTLVTRKNNVTANQTITITGSTTGEFSDTTNSDTVTAGELWNYQLITGAGGTTFIFRVLNALFAAGTGTVQHFQTSNGNNIVGNNVTHFENLVGEGAAATNTTENLSQAKMKIVGTFQNLFTNIRTNARTATCTMRLRKNGANGNINIAITAATTGVLEDTANTDIVAVNDLVCVGVVLSAEVTNLRLWCISIEFSTASGFNEILNGDETPAAFASNTTYFLGVGGVMSPATTLESEMATTINILSKFSLLNCFVSANTVTAGSTLKTRKNSGAANLSVALTASTTGYFEDATNTDLFLATDKVNYSVTTGATGTSLTMTNIGVLVDFSVGQPTMRRWSNIKYLGVSNSYNKHRGW